jgi:Tfp pilus assembly protein PilN
LLLTLWVSHLERRVADLEGQIEAIDQETEEIRKQSDAVAKLEAWTEQDFVWLDELKRLSEKLPPSEHLMVTSLEMDATLRGGQIRIDGLVDDNPVIKQIAEDLASRYQIEPGTRGDDESQPPYTKRFDGARVLMLKPEVRQ